jgi:16S rRNA (guanine966-N2)-methyltransferase
MLFCMRIVSGSAGGLHLKVPKGYTVRPTADRVREAIFNILVSRFPLADISILDLFAGTGALGIEALSRGARSAVFVDASPTAQQVIQENLNATGFRRRGRIIRAYTPKGIKVAEGQGLRFGGVFLDPPYGEGWVDKTLRLLARSPILEPDAWIVVEHGQREEGAESYPPLALTDRRRYGTTGVSFYQRQGEEGA